jgi:hypothetical protein
MYLIFPESMVIPEVAERREDDDFEDWLTAALIESASQQHLNGVEASARGVTDLWILEIGERTGKVWRGRFQVEFNQEDEQLPEDASTQEQGTRVISFCLDTHTGEMSFDPEEQGTQDVSAETALG